MEKMRYVDKEGLSHFTQKVKSLVQSGIQTVATRINAVEESSLQVDTETSEDTDEIPEKQS